MYYYAVLKGKIPGIYHSWDECKDQINGFSGAKFKKFSTEADANNYLANTTTTISCDKHIDYFVYTDGSCSKNGSNNAKAGIGIYFKENDMRNTSKRIDGKQTNNTAELSAIIEAYKIIKDDVENGKNIVIVSDSEYAIKCATSYGKKCAQNNFEKDTPNKELVKEIYTLFENKSNITFLHCRAHTSGTDQHSIGNDGADKLANQAIGLTHCPYNQERIYLNVGYKDKDYVKSLGGLWDQNKKKWYIFDNNENKDKIITLYKSI